MDNITDELRQMFAENAGQAPPGVELLAATRVRSRQRLRRRRAGLTGLVALAVAAGAAAVPVLVGAVVAPPAAPTAAGSAATPTHTASPSPTTTEIRFVPATAQPTVSFPFSPTFIPAGLPPAAVDRTESDFVDHHFQTNDSRWLKLEQHQTKPTLSEVPGLAGARTQSVRVRGHAATLATAGAITYLLWPETPQVWLSITSVGVSRADVLHYAEGLQAKTISGTEAYHFALVPAGMVVHESLHWSMTFAPTGPNAEPLIGVTVDKQGGSSHPGQLVHVGSRTGHLVDSAADGRDLVVDLGGGATLEVIVPATVSDADLISFAAGITVDLSTI